MILMIHPVYRWYAAWRAAPFNIRIRKRASLGRAWSELHELFSMCPAILESSWNFSCTGNIPPHFREHLPFCKNSPRVESRCRDQRCETTQSALSDSNSPLDLSGQKSPPENFSGVRIRGLSIPVPKNQFWYPSMESEFKFTACVHCLGEILISHVEIRIPILNLEYSPRL